MCLRGTDVVKETANDREVLDICNDHVALCKVKVAISVSNKVSRTLVAGKGEHLCAGLEEISCQR